MKRETEKTENLLEWDDIDEECMALALPKIVKVYEKSKDGEVGSVELICFLIS